MWRNVDVIQRIKKVKREVFLPFFVSKTELNPIIYLYFYPYIKTTWLHLDASQNIFNQPKRFTKNERRKRYQILSYITTLTVVFFSVIFFSISENFEALIAFIFAGLFSLNQLLSRFTKSLITIHIFFVTLSLTVAFFGACGGANLGNYLYYFPEVIAVIWLYHT